MFRKSISNGIAILIFFLTIALSTLLIFLPRYLEIRSLQNSYKAKIAALKKVYEYYELQKANFSMLKNSLVNVKSIEEFTESMPSNARVKVNDNHIIISGGFSNEDLFKIIKLVLNSANYNFTILKLQNTFAIPFVVFPLKEKIFLKLEAEIEQLEVKK